MSHQTFISIYQYRFGDDAPSLDNGTVAFFAARGCMGLFGLEKAEKLQLTDPRDKARIEGTDERISRNMVKFGSSGVEYQVPAP